MADLHIDDFYKDVARTLDLLYRVFPRKATLFVEDVSGPDEPDEFGLHSPRHMACLGALIWLAEEGHLRYGSTIRQEAVDEVVLAGPTFTLLAATAHRLTEEEAQAGTAPATADGAGLPDSVRQLRRTNIARLRDALRSRSSSLLRAVVLDLLDRATAGRGR